MPHWVDWGCQSLSSDLSNLQIAQKYCGFWVIWFTRRMILMFKTRWKFCGNKMFSIFFTQTGHKFTDIVHIFFLTKFFYHSLFFILFDFIFLNTLQYFDSPNAAQTGRRLTECSKLYDKLLKSLFNHQTLDHFEKKKDSPSAAQTGRRLTDIVRIFFLTKFFYHSLFFFTLMFSHFSI